MSLVLTPGVLVIGLSVSCHAPTGMLAVGWRQDGSLLPSEVRVLDYELGELVAEGLSARLDSARACGARPLVDLDELVADGERILARRRSAAGGGELV